MKEDGALQLLSQDLLPKVPERLSLLPQPPVRPAAGARAPPAAPAPARPHSTGAPLPELAPPQPLAPAASGDAAFGTSTRASWASALSTHMTNGVYLPA